MKKHKNFRKPTKLVLLGNAGVGKSSLAFQFVRQAFSDYRDSTIGATFLQKTVILNDCNITFEIWDTAGQERYRSLVPMYYRNAAAAIIVYDATDKETFNKAKTWINDLRIHNINTSIIIALACNKIDLLDDLNTKEAKQYASDNQLLFFETSAKINYNVNEIFQKIAEKIAEQDNDIDLFETIEYKEVKSSICCYKI